MEWNSKPFKKTTQDKTTFLKNVRVEVYTFSFQVYSLLFMKYRRTLTSYSLGRVCVQSNPRRLLCSTNLLCYCLEQKKKNRIVERYPVLLNKNWQRGLKAVITLRKNVFLWYRFCARDELLCSFKFSSTQLRDFNN